MKNKSFAVIIFIVFNFSQCVAQNKTYFGIEASITNDIYEFRWAKSYARTITLIHRNKFPLSA